MSAFPWAEVGLAKIFGVTRELLRQIRENSLIKGEDWITDGKSIQLTEKAAQQVAAYLGVKIAKKPVLDSPVNGNEPLHASLVVVRKVMNPHVLVAMLPGGLEVLVNVKHNQNFRPGM